MKFTATRIAKSATMPPAEYHSVSLVRFIFLSCTLVADDDPGREEREADHRDEKQDVARVEHAALESFEVRHDGERRDGLNEDRVRPSREQIGHRRVAGEDEEETDQHR